jgi:hypothetical protein
MTIGGPITRINPMEGWLPQPDAPYCQDCRSRLGINNMTMGEQKQGRCFFCHKEAKVRVVLPRDPGPLFGGER